MRRLCLGGCGRTTEGSYCPSCDRSPFAGAKETYRRIPAKLRTSILTRDGNRCTWVTNGARCPETEHLEVDHVVPQSRGGSDDPSNLRTLCRGHHRRHTGRTFGKGKVSA